ncbi:MAG: NnrU family protein [Rhodospirillales bacterium]|jgi:uncharacterized membrane protein
MTGSIVEVALAGALLLLSHFVPPAPGNRARIVARTGEGAYMGLYSLVSVAAIVWLCLAWAAAPVVPLWEAGILRWVPAVVLPFALILFVAAYTTRNPTSVGQGASLLPETARGVLRITRNPLLWSVTAWALSHLVANGDLASVLFFGTFAMLAGLGTVLLERKIALREGARWDAFAAVTSNVPFAAILQGRQRLDLREIGPVRIGAAFALTLALVQFHGWLFGVPAIPPG